MTSTTTHSKGTTMTVSLTKITPALTQSIDDLQLLADHWDGVRVELNHLPAWQAPFYGITPGTPLINRNEGAKIRL